MAPTHLKIICLNIEKNTHLNRVLSFFNRERPDVVLLQEVLERDIPLLESSLEMKSIFTPMARFMLQGLPQIGGQAILTNLPLIETQEKYYRGSKDSLPFIELTPGASEAIARALSIVRVVKEGKSYCLANTHFTWAPDGLPSTKQTHDLDSLFDLLASLSDVVLCGDFNAPRGTPIFDKLTSRFKDNIPSHVTTTLDKNWHKAGDLQLVVDGVFTTPHYYIDSINLADNVSDHFAIIANVAVV